MPVFGLYANGLYGIHCTPPVECTPSNTTREPAVESCNAPYLRLVLFIVLRHRCLSHSCLRPHTTYRSVWLRLHSVAHRVVIPGHLSYTPPSITPYDTLQPTTFFYLPLSCPTLPFPSATPPFRVELSVSLT